MSLIKYFSNPLNILVIIVLSLALFTTLGSYKEGFTEQSNNININGIEIKNTLFTGKNGNTARIISSNGKYIIIVRDNTGKETQYIYSPNGNTNNNKISTSVTSYDSPTSTNFMKNRYNKTIFYGPNGSTAEIIRLNGTVVIQIKYSSGDVVTFTQDTQINQPAFYPNQASYSSTYYNQLKNQPTMYNQSNMSNKPNMYNQSNMYNKPKFNNDYDYSSSLPPAIPASQIPLGQEDLYILKSEIVPPVCPAPITACHHKTDKCAPCPPCGRCPEPNFECKKVPSYKPDNSDLPVPFISPFSTFGS
jgi:formylmethanofuran dehydrogenase subunit D